MAQFSKAFAGQGKLYKALEQAPSNISVDDRAVFLYYTLMGYNLGKGIPTGWEKFRDNYDWFESSFMIYIDENE
jgi:hypothetical protein